MTTPPPTGADTTPSSAESPSYRRHLPRRSEHDRVAGGVAAGVGEAYALDPIHVRIAFVVLALAGGWGLFLYAAAWLLFNSEDAEAGTYARVPHDPSRPGRQSLALAMVVAGGVLLARNIGFGFSDSIVWPVAIGGCGAALLWRRDSNGFLQSARPWVTDNDRLLRVDAVRVLAGLLIAILGVTGLVAGNIGDVAKDGITVLVVVAGVAVVFLPWWWRAAKDLAEERRRRIRSDERAEVAAHLHDSVLQTLALIQKRTDDPETMAALARRQERELRRWLFNGPQRADGADFEQTLRHVIGEIEDLHEVVIEVVVVGTSPVDEDIESLIAATREAATNAAKFAGDAPIDVFAEVKADAIEVFVRDRGPGFDPSTIETDRRGVRESVIGRMDRAGGSATIFSEMGDGTEVELRLPRESEAE